MYETVNIPRIDEIKVVNRKKATVITKDFQPYQPDEDLVPLFVPFGSPLITRANSSGHGIDGYPCEDAENHEQLVRRLINKIDKYKEEILLFKEYYTHDAEVLIVSYGCSTRPAIAAMKEARKRGIKVGILQLQTLWPFPEKLIESITSKAKLILVPELALGQLKSEIIKYCHQKPVIGINKLGGVSIQPDDILTVLFEEIEK